MTESGTILLDHSGALAQITIDRASEHNSLDSGALQAFHTCLDHLEALKQVRVLLVTGSGDETFCAGASLKQLQSGEMEPALFTGLTDRLEALALPTVCALNGSVYGGGVEIALCCDFRVGIQGSRLRVPAGQIGLCYPLNGMRRFVSQLGLQTTRRLLLTCEELDAATMLALGFLDRLVERDQLEHTAGQLCAELAELAPLALRAMKISLNQIAGGEVDDTFLGDLGKDCIESEDLREGLAAKRERRTARFSGR